MGTFRERRVVSRCVLCAVLCGGGLGSHAEPPSSPWTIAVAERARFEAQPKHTRAEFARVMDGFRAIYHADPQDLHAPAAIAQVAELLAEQGRELSDPKSLANAAGQCGFLAKSYPVSTAARTCHSYVDALVKDRDKAEDQTVETAGSKAPPTAQVRSIKTKLAAPKVEAADAAKPATTIATNPPMARVTGIRHWSTPSYTRVAIDLGDDVQYEAARVEHPDRIFFDLHHAHLAPELVGKSFTVTDDGFLTRIRAAQYTEDVTRVVLDVHEVAEYSAFLLPNPSRLIIDIHGKASISQEMASDDKSIGNGKRTASNILALPSGSIPEAIPEKSSTRNAEAGVSQLPPMPVTDGSAGFGLPPRVAIASTTENVAVPRVVIPAKPTVAKPVPNTVTSKSASTGVDVAAVSEQPGKVEATIRPTSSPIASGARKRASSKRQDDVGTDAAPVEAPPPTADGKTSLVRALGLKIGRIVIDAGHGGHDSGTLGVGGIEEKDVVLDVALRLGKLLHQKLGAEIVYTRADDTFIPLETRTAIANKAQADLFISIHANSSQEPSARGVEVYYLNFTSDPEAMRVAGRENAVSTQSVHELSDLVKKIALKDKIDESKELAADVDESLFAGLMKGNQGLRNRGVKKAPFVVLIGANMPSILAEISFVTNPQDAAELLTPEYRERVAESLYSGVAKYAGAINGPSSVAKAVLGR